MGKLTINRLSHGTTRLLCKNIKIKKLIVPVVLYVCDPSSLTIREEHRLRVFENGVARIIFGSTRMEVTRDWRKLHKEEFHNLYLPNSIKWSNSRRMGWTRHEEQMAENGN
jgi:hypothetical protein